MELGGQHYIGTAQHHHGPPREAAWTHWRLMLVNFAIQPASRIQRWAATSFAAPRQAVHTKHAVVMLVLSCKNIWTPPKELLSSRARKIFCRAHAGSPSIATSERHSWDTYYIDTQSALVTQPLMMIPRVLQSLNVHNICVLMKNWEKICICLPCNGCSHTEPGAYCDSTCAIDRQRPT